jgi:hypothetical protein
MGLANLKNMPLVLCAYGVRNAQRHRLLVSCAAAYFFAAGFFLVGFLVGRLRPPPPPPGSPGPAPNSIVEGNVMVDSPFLEL